MEIIARGEKEFFLVPSVSFNRVIFRDEKGKMRQGSLKIRAIRCGKANCSKCPHEIYAYAQYRDGKKVKDKYLGVATGMVHPTLFIPNK